MPTRVHKDGVRCTITEYVVIVIDEHGDALSHAQYESQADAIKAASQLVDGIHETDAIVVEKSVRRYPAHLFRDWCDKATTVWTYGNQDALDAGCWIEHD